MIRLAVPTIGDELEAGTELDETGSEVVTGETEFELAGCEDVLIGAVPGAEPPDGTIVELQ